MPASLFVSFNINPKSFKLTALFLLSPLFFFAQSLTGLWNGALANDSSILRTDQPFEMALTEYKGKVYGYSRRSFIVNDTLYYVLKRVKGNIEGDSCEVTENEYVSYNFPGDPDKGVKITYTFRFNKNDSSWSLDGKWKTNKVKRHFYALTGKVELKQEKDLSKSKLFPHLEELNLANDVAFYKERKKEKETSVVKIVAPENKRADAAIKTEQSYAIKDAVAIPVKDDSKTNDAASKPVELTESPDDTYVNGDLKKPEDIRPITRPIVAGKTEEIKKMPVSPTQDLTKDNERQKQEIISSINKKDVAIIKTEQPVINKESITTSNKPDIKGIAKTTTPVSSAPIKQTGKEIKKPETTMVTANDNAIALANTVIEKKEIKNNPVIVTTNPEKNNDNAPANKAAEYIKERKSELSQVVNFKSDSLELALYDNGEIDGDTVSVLLNGEIILARQCLKAYAIKKTIYITPGSDAEFTLILYAENLGKYPPNTGLLVVHDGDDVYNVRFSADFQKNAGVVFKRKK